MKNKKAISEVISYVLLIVIAVGLSIVVYAFLKLYVPLDKPVCEEDVSLILTDPLCKGVSGSMALNFTLTNKGLFNVDGVYVRFSKINRNVRYLLSENPYFDRTYFDLPIGQNFLYPGNSTTWYSYNYPELTPGENYTIEIQPAMRAGKKKQIALCDKAIITQNIQCS